MVERGSVLIVDDDPTIRAGCQEIFEEEGYFVETAENGLKALEKMKGQEFDLVILDLVMPGMDGIETLERIKKMDTETLVIIITGYATVETAVKAMKQGAYDYIAKPFTPDELRLVVQKAIEHRNLQKDYTSLKQGLEQDFQLKGIVGNSPQMQEVYKLVRKVAATKSTVLIYGESGTGKELVARAIHYLSPRRDKPFIPVNCGSLSETLLESELFGHIKGSFTGAITTKPGLFEVANGGTVFLDEIGDLSLSIQGKLLRVLQEREFTPVGGTKPIKVDVRLIAATNKDLERGIREGTFREDLFYRLHIVPVFLPPLRERREDIPALAYHFLERYNRETKKNIRKIADDAMHYLLIYDWPGNVRELENAIQRAVIMEKGDTLRVEDFFVNVQEKAQRLKEVLSYKEAKRKAIVLFDREFIRERLKESQGNVTKAAQAAKMDRRNFQRLMRKYQIKGKDFKLT